MTAAFEGAQAAADKPACVGDIRSDANCFSVKPASRAWSGFQPIARDRRRCHRPQ